MGKHVFEGIKVADFSWVVIGPTITKYLAEHGAEVILVETAQRPNPLRTAGPYRDKKPGIDRTAFFTNYNDNKYGITINLNHPRGREVAKKLVAWADIMVENFTPGVAAKLGLGYEELSRIKPGLIMLSTSSQGQTGPFARRPGMGVQLAAQAGFVQLTGWSDRESAVPFGAHTDYIAAPLGGAALIAALAYRQRTGKGQYLDLSQYEASVYVLSPLILDFTINGRVANRMGNRCPYAAPHGAYRCRGDDRWCVIAVFNDEEWQSFCNVLGNPTWTKDTKFATLLARKENEEELDGLIEEWTVNFSAEEVMEMMQAAGVAVGVVQTSEELFRDPQLRHRYYFWELEHPEIGKHHYSGSVFALSKTPAELKMAAPCLGQHTEYVCTQILGIPQEEFVELLNDCALD